MDEINAALDRIETAVMSEIKPNVTETERELVKDALFIGKAMVLAFLRQSPPKD